MSKRYIDVDAAVSNAEARYGEWVLAMAAAEGTRQINMVYKKQELFKAVKKVIESCPSVDLDGLRPVAHWNMDEDAVGDPIVWTCSNCKDCPDRHPICHDSCPKYAEYKRQLKAQRIYTNGNHAAERISRNDFDKEGWMGGRKR